MVELSKLLVPRVVLAVIGLLATVVLMITETVSSEVGVVIIIGILASFGAWKRVSPSDN